MRCTASKERTKKREEILYSSGEKGGREEKSKMPLGPETITMGALAKSLGCGKKKREKRKINWIWALTH